MLQPSRPIEIQPNVVESHPSSFPALPDATVMRQLVDLATDRPDEAILVVRAAAEDRGRSVVFANSAYLAMSGYDEAELIDRPVRGFLAPHLEDDESTRLLTSLERDEPSHGVAVTYRADGSEYLLDWHAMPLADRCGRVTHYALLQRALADHSRSAA